VRNGVPVSAGAQFPVHPVPGVEMAGGYSIIPVALVVGFGLLLLTHKLARRWIAWLRTRVNPLRRETAVRM
jgi:hypothetical protein